MTLPARVITTGYTPRPWQAEVHESTKRFSVLVVHRRGGKTVLAVNTLVHAAVTCDRPSGRYGYIAPFLGQARRVAWDYLRQYTANIPGVTTNSTLAQVTLPNGARIAIYGADNPDALRGVYFDGVVLDEVADLRPNVWGEIIRPALTDRHGWMLAIGTPRGLNLFSEMYYRALRDPEWYAALYDCNATDALPPEEIERARREMTEPQFAQEMLCDFSAAVENALIPLEVARAAAGRHLVSDLYSTAPRVMGVDVARYGGDSSVILKRQGFAVLGLHTLRGLDTMAVGSQVALRADAFEPDAVFIDVGGIGAGVFDRVLQLGYPAIPVDFGSRPDDPRFMNKRCELWWRASEWLSSGAIPDDEHLIAELCGPRFSFANSRGKVELESKDAMRKRGLPSPDRADALAVTFAHPVSPRGLRAGAGRAKTEYDPFKDRS